MHPQVDIVRTSTPLRSTATTGSHTASPLARTLLNLEKPMRFTTLATTLTLATTCFTAGCLGDTGSSRKPGAKTPVTTPDGSCAKVEKDVTIRAAADMTALPKTGCYDLYGKLTIQGSAVTSLAGLNELNSVNELDLDHTSLTAIDTKLPVGIYGKLAVTGNAKLTNLKQLSFETAATGILIDGNTVLATLEPLGLDDPRLGEVDGDIAITGNGAVTISNNAALKTVDLTNLATTGHVELADNAQLTSLTGFAATTINGDLAIRNNAALTTLGTMSSLYRVTGNLTIDGNAALTNLAAFGTSVKLVDLALTISNNQNLADLGALKHLQLVGAITITNNQALVTCRATEIDRCTQHPTAAVINNNKSTNCNWQCN
jgi:receptor L domain-containing protein